MNSHLQFRVHADIDVELNPVSLLYFSRASQFLFGFEFLSCFLFHLCVIFFVFVWFSIWMLFLVVLIFMQVLGRICKNNTDDVTIVMKLKCSVFLSVSLTTCFLTKLEDTVLHWCLIMCRTITLKRNVTASRSHGAVSHQHCRCLMYRYLYSCAWQLTVLLYLWGTLKYFCLSCIYFSVF